MYCGNCGTKNKKGADFCKYCGSHLKSKWKSGRKQQNLKRLMNPASLKKRNIIAICIAAVILIIGSVGGYAAYSNTGSRLVEKQLSLGEKYLSELNYEAAIVAFTKVIDVDPKNVDAYVGLTDAYIGNGEPDKAVTTVHNGLTRVPGSEKLVDKLVEVETKVGQDSTNSGDYEKAIAAYQDVITYKPDCTDAYVGLTEAYIRSGDTEKANSTIESAKSSGQISKEELAEINKKSAEKQIADGEAYLSTNDYNSAVTAFKNAIKFQSDNPKAYLGLADAYLGLGDTNDAISKLKDAIAKIPNNADLYFKLADIYIGQKDYQKASDILQTGVNETGDTALITKLEEVNKALASAKEVTYRVNISGASEKNGSYYIFFKNYTEYEMIYTYSDKVCTNEDSFETAMENYYNNNYPVTKYKNGSVTEIPIQNIIIETGMSKSEILQNMIDCWWFPNDDYDFLYITDDKINTYRLSDTCDIKLWGTLSDNLVTSDGMITYTKLNPQQLVSRIMREVKNDSNLYSYISYGEGIEITIKNGEIIKFVENYHP